MIARHKTWVQGSNATPLSSDDLVPDSEAITVRTPTAGADVLGEEAPPTRRLSPNATLPMSTRPVPLSARAPVSRQSEAAWFDREPPPYVAPGVPEVAEPLGPSLHAQPARRGSRAVGFAAASLFLVGIAVAGTAFFFGTRSTNEAKAPDTTSTTQITNAEVSPTPAPPPTPAPVTPPETTVKPAMKVATPRDVPRAPVTSTAPNEPEPASTTDEPTQDDNAASSLQDRR